MAKELFNRYVWIVDTLNRHGRITRHELNRLWMESSLSQGRPLARRTFLNDRQAIQEMFDINIECDLSTYEYYIDDPDSLHSNSARVWTLNSFAVNSLLNESQELHERIALENIPNGQDHLRTLFDAMKLERATLLAYHSFTRTTGSHTLMAPYFVKLFRQRWYVVGKDLADGKIKTYALDRIDSLTLSERHYTYPANFSPSNYFKGCYGITHSDLPTQEVVLRVPALQANYLRTLPLHESQVESDRGEKSSIFRYQLKITPDLIQELYARSYWQIEVLAPQSLRQHIAEQLRSNLDKYQPKTI